MTGDHEAQRDEELMLAVGQGDQQAMAELVRRYHARVYGYVYRNLHGHHMSEDVTQECFVRLLEAAARYEYPRPFKPWLYTIAHNLCRSIGRSASFRLNVPLQEPDAVVGGSQTEDEALVQLDKEEVERALGALSMEHREVVVLRFYEDMKVHEVAEVLSLPVGTVKSRLFYAVRALRGRMEAEE